MLGTLAVDFDETITTADTTPHLPRLAMAGLPPLRADELRRRWEEGSKGYYARWQTVYENALATLSPLPDPCEAACQFSRHFHSVEQDSIAAVIQEGFLRGIRRADLRDLGARVDKRDGALEALREARAYGFAIHVISANWSRDVVRAGIGLPDAEIHSNDLEFNRREVSTGILIQRVVSGRDKLERFRLIKSKRGPNIFIGDSVTDLLPLLNADIGVLIGEKSSPLTVCERIGVPVVPLEPNVTPGPKRLYKADSWAQIEQALFS